MRGASSVVKTYESENLVIRTSITLTKRERRRHRGRDLVATINRPGRNARRAINRMEPDGAHGPKRLDVVLNNFECGKVDAWPCGTQARWSLDADYENADHLERTFFVPRRPELSTAHKGHGFKHTRGRILRFGIDCVDCSSLPR